MSDSYDDLDIESDDENDSDTRSPNYSSINGIQFLSQAERRAHHNALERKRRDDIKDYFVSLRETVPSLQETKSASRGQILQGAAKFIQHMANRNVSPQRIEQLKRQNKNLEEQIKHLEQLTNLSVINGGYKDMKTPQTSSEELTNGDDAMEQKSKKFKPNNYAM
ncbi:Protein max, partial [Pseudolycoriella hygida]